MKRSDLEFHWHTQKLAQFQNIFLHVLAKKALYSNEAKSKMEPFSDALLHSWSNQSL
jgi:hypothetical protein